MGTMLGNLIALMAIVVMMVVVLISFEVVAMCFTVFSYLTWVLHWVLNWSTKPRRDPPFCFLLSPANLNLG